MAFDSWNIFLRFYSWDAFDCCNSFFSNIVIYQQIVLKNSQIITSKIQCSEGSVRFESICNRHSSCISNLVPYEEVSSKYNQPPKCKALVIWNCDWFSWRNLAIATASSESIPSSKIKLLLKIADLRNLLDSTIFFSGQNQKFFCQYLSGAFFTRCVFSLLKSKYLGSWNHESSFFVITNQPHTFFFVLFCFRQKCQTTNTKASS